MVYNLSQSLCVVTFQDVVENWEVYDDKLTSMNELLQTTRSSITDEGYHTLTTDQLEDQLDRSCRTSLEVRALLYTLFIHSFMYLKSLFINDLG